MNDVAPWCWDCGTSMDACGELGDDCWACDDCEIGAQVNRRALGQPVVVEFFGLEHGSADA